MAYRDNDDFSYRFDDDDSLLDMGGMSFAEGELNPNAPDQFNTARGPGRSPAPSAPATPANAAASAGNPNAPVVQGWYNQYLGRTATDDEVASHTGNGAFRANDPRLESSRQAVENGWESKNYRQVQAFQQQVARINQSADPSQRAQLRDKLARDLFSSLQQQGYDVSWQGEQLKINGRLYDLAGAEGATSSPAAGGPASASASSPWTPVDNLDDLSFDRAYSHARPYEFTGFEDLGPTDAATENLVLSLLQNPESLSPHMVEVLKGRSKDELAEMQRTRDEDLVGAQFAMGYEDDSPFFRSERNDALRDYDRSLVDSNREIDIGAAETNTADRRAAAGIGQSYVGQRFNRAQTGESNKQAAAASRQSATSLAGNLALGRAGLLTNDRQFNADYLLRRLSLEHGIDQDMFERFIAQFALGV